MLEKSNVGAVTVNYNVGVAAAAAHGVRQFIRWYLGTAEAPKPFAGRAADLANLNSWLRDECAPPKLLMVAPGGRGKSMLLVQWISQLSSEELDVIFVPISLRYETNRPTVFYEALAARIAEVSGHSLVAPLHNATEYYKNFAADFLAEVPLQDRRCLLVIDGLDEATGGKIDITLLPERPPPGLKIVLSARLTAQRDAARWCEEIGWDARDPTVKVVALQRLDRQAIEEILQASGLPKNAALHLLAGAVSELTQGDPLLTQLYAEDLAREAQLGRQPDVHVLSRLRPGYGAFFRNSLDQQKHFWRAGSQPDPEHIKTLLAILAVAKGPLTHDELSQLSSLMLQRQVITDDDTIAFIDRFLLRSPSGYSLFHPRLAEFLRDEYLRNGGRISRAEQAVVDWGRTILADLRDHSRSSCAPAYLLQFLGEHLAESDSADDCILLLDKSWLRAWRDYEHGDFQGLSAEVTRVDGILAISTRRKDRVAHRVHARLILSSIRSLGSAMNAEVLGWAVENDQITPLQALRWARDQSEASDPPLLKKITDRLQDASLQAALEICLSVRLADRPKFACALMPRLPEGRADEVLARITEEARAAGKLSETLRRLGQHAAFRNADQIVEAARSQGFRALVLDVLQGFAERLPPGEDRFPCLDELIEPPQNRHIAARLSKLLAALYVRAGAALRSQIQEPLLQAILAADKIPATQAISTLARQMPISWRSAILTKARAEDWGEARMWLAEFLSPAECLSLLQRSLEYGVPEEAQRLAVLALPADLQRQYVETVLAISERRKSLERLSVVSSALKFSLHAECSQIIHETDWNLIENDSRGELPVLAKILPEPLWPEFVDVVLGIRDERTRSWIATESLQFAPPPLRDRLIKDVEANLGQFEPHGPDMAEVLARIGPWLEPGRREDALRTAVSAAAGSAMYGRSGVVALALSTCPTLGAEMFRDALRISDDDARVSLLLALTSHVEADVKGEVLDLAWGAACNAPFANRARLRVRVAVDAARSGDGRFIAEARSLLQSDAPRAVVPSLTAELADVLPLREQLDLLEAEGVLWPECRAKLLVDVGLPHLSAEQARTIGERVMKQALSGSTEGFSGLLNLEAVIMHLLPTLTVQDVAEILDRFCPTWPELVRHWIVRALAPVLPHGRHLAVLNLLREGSDIESLVDSTIAIISSAPTKVRRDIVDLVVGDVLGRATSDTRYQLVAKLLPTLDDEQVQRLFVSASDIESSPDRAGLFECLLPRLDESAISYVYRQIELHVNEGIGMLEWHRLLYAIAEYLPEHLLCQATALASATRGVPVSVAAMCRLALRLSEAERRRLLDEITRSPKWMTMLPRADTAELIRHLPDDRVDQLIASLPSGTHRGQRLEALEAIVKHAPTRCDGALVAAVCELKGTEKASCAALLTKLRPAYAAPLTEAFAAGVCAENTFTTMKLLRDHVGDAAPEWADMLIRVYLETLPHTVRAEGLRTAEGLLPAFMARGGAPTMLQLARSVANVGDWLP